MDGSLDDSLDSSNGPARDTVPLDSLPEHPGAFKFEPAKFAVTRLGSLDSTRLDN